MAAAYVQSANGTGFASSTVTATFTTSNNTTGNILVAFANGGLAPTITFTDGAGNTWTSIGTGTSGFSFTCQAGWAQVVSGGGTKITITANFTVASGNQTLIITELSGIDTTTPVDNFAYANTTFGTGTDAFSSGNFTTTNNGCLIYGAITDENGNANAFSAGTGFTRRESYTFDGGGRFAASEDLIQSTAGSIAATFTNTVGGAIGNQVGVGFKPGGGGPPASTVKMLAALGVG